MTTPDGDASLEDGQREALERLTMNYPVEFDRLPDAAGATEPADTPGDD